MPTASRPRSGVAAARACREAKEELRTMARDFAWGFVVFVGIGALYLCLAS